MGYWGLSGYGVVFENIKLFGQPRLFFFQNTILRLVGLTRLIKKIL
jgi:hypothetical protein